MKVTNLIIRTAAFSTHSPRPYTGKPYEEIKGHKVHISPVYAHYYKEPFLAV